MKKVLITGARGFLATNLIERVSGLFKLSLLDRNDVIENQFHESHILNIDSVTSYEEALSGVDCIIHCAARVHLMDDGSHDPLAEYREVNSYGTANLANQAAKAGVKRFIFISSIKVNGDASSLGCPMTPGDICNPADFYGISKYEAELELSSISKSTGMEIVIIRPTLVYGPGVKANFASLLNLVSKGLPLPFGCIKNNKRSLVSVTNLVDLIVTCIEHPKAPNQVFLVSDDHDVSTASMVKYMSQALGKSNRLLPVPLWCYRLVGKLAGKSDVVDRLIGSLQVDITHTKDTLGWVPPQTLEQGFKETAEAFIINKNK